MQTVLGVFFHLIGGVAAGSFYMPYKKVERWNWETYWLVGGLFSWLIIPPIMAWLTLPGFWELIWSMPPATLGYIILFGLLWGIGGLTYGLGIRYLGLSLGNTVILGFSAAFGALVPTIYYDFFPKEGKTTFNELISSTWGQVILLGILICLLGIAICGKAGMMKEKQLPQKEQSKTNNEFNLFKGLSIGLCSGILSSCFNFGIEAGQSLAESAVAAGMNPLFQNNATFVVLLWGGLTLNLIWCVSLNIRNKSFGDYSDLKKPLGKNYLLCALAGTTWFLQFFFYGMGESKLGNGATGWVLHMSCIILVGNIWGIVLKEWKETGSRAKITVGTGIFVILISVALLGYGNYLRSI
ncbi:L-rhamnose/proton symporter RhaT [Zobellia russellii]|uniref:L-rhamnose/proton symporter RhaT n=1 Tax=Zobellia russellii TaxID=248907 RepID=UPI001BFF6AC4|nr:L-rhamnose/proton symporter RhaT [Zobellia russellii]MBT9188271.1 L-rhamnose/proton symporter RhaT [Zobellia russellii]